MKFQKPWWIDSEICGITQAGLGKTDLPLRVCVYPSYNLKDTGPSVLLCSYTWGQDSERVASLIKQNDPEDEGPDPAGDTPPTDELNIRLRDLMFDNLAKLHSGPDMKKTYEEMYQIIKDNYITHHAYDWSKDPFASSAFALFSAGDFRKLYSTLVRPAADSRFHIVGEAASAHHAWIVGALDSALRGVHLFLERFGLRAEQKTIQDAMMVYKDPKDPKKPDPKEREVPRFGTTGEVDYETAHLQVALGMLGSVKLPVDHVATK